MSANSLFFEISKLIEEKINAYFEITLLYSSLDGLDSLYHTDRRKLVDRLQVDTYLSSTYSSSNRDATTMGHIGLHFYIDMLLVSKLGT